MMAGAMAILPVMDTVAKHLAATYPVAQVVWARYFFHMTLLLPLVLWRHGLGSLIIHRSASQIVRGGFLLGSTVLFFAAIARMPLADALALVFVAPIVVTALSPWLLGERVGVRRWSAVAVGFLGVLVMVRPGFAEMGLGHLLALGAGIVYGLYSLATRRLSGSAPALVTLTYTALLGAVAMSLAVPFVWLPPTPGDLGLMVLTGCIAMIGHFLIIRAFEQAEASLLAPFIYTEIVMATTLGFLVFGDFPDPWTWIGIAVVIASGLYIMIRERRLRG
jgi:drug/metabolite transporter (DMT)-like permease